MRTDSPVSIDIVIERQLLIGFDVALGKDSHTHLVANRPLGDHTIGITRVIQESTLASLFSGVDKLMAIPDWTLAVKRRPEDGYGTRARPNVRRLSREP